MLKNIRLPVMGFTFTEMLVALAINAFILTALVGVFIGNLNHYRETINLNRMNLQLETAMAVMTNDIRRAGYWSNAKNDVGTGANTNPFMVTGSTDITVDGSCILFTYDHNSDGTLPSISTSGDDERYGFRLSGGAIQARPPGATFACNAASSNWENLTDPNVVTITGLTFTLTPYTMTSGSKSILLRSVDITISAVLTSNTSITRTLTQHVRLSNGKFIP